MWHIYASTPLRSTTRTQWNTLLHKLDRYVTDYLTFLTPSGEFSCLYPTICYNTCIYNSSRLICTLGGHRIWPTLVQYPVGLFLSFEGIKRHHVNYLFFILMYHGSEIWLRRHGDNPIYALPDLTSKFYDKLSLRSPCTSDFFSRNLASR
jgi:hypothetical protein